MLNVGIFELLLIAGIALMVVGPEQLPKLFRSAGHWYGQARRAADELRRAFVLEADRQDASDRYELMRERRRKQAEERAAFQPETVVQDEGSVSEESPEPEVDDAAQVVDVNADAPDAPHPTRPVPVTEVPGE